MNVSTQHKQQKFKAYWEDLTAGTTGQYKEGVIDHLINEHFDRRGARLLDIGAGTCGTILKYAQRFDSLDVALLDYDAAVIEQMKAEYRGSNIQWIVADIFDLDPSLQFDLVFTLDMLHEVYSFYGRPRRVMEEPVEHEIGLGYVQKALAAIAQIISPGGGLVITDNVLCPENNEVRVRCLNPKVQRAVAYFFENFPTKRIPHIFLSDGAEVCLNSRDFCILLTQYNKIKAENWTRWNVEQFEIHQYLCLEQYRQILGDLGFEVHAVIGTPHFTLAEWREDFQIVEGLTDIPEKRITLLAIKKVL